MPSTQLPNIGLYKGWSLNDKNWGDEMNANLCKLDAMVAVGVTGQIATADLPVTGNQGEQYLLTDTNEIATFQGGVWLKCPIPKGLPILDCASGVMFTFDGASVVPMEVNIPEASVADVLAGVPDLFVTSEVLCDSLNDIFGAGVITGIVPPTAPPAPKELPIYCDTVAGVTYVWDGAAWVSKEAAEPDFTITYDEAGAGAASADLFVKTGPDGCIDSKLVKRYPTYATTTAYETALGGAGNLVGGERMYDPALGLPVYYNAITGQWEKEVAEPLKKAVYSATQAAQTFQHNVAQTVIYGTPVIDDFGGSMAANGIWTVPAGCDGCYIVEYSVGVTFTTTVVTGSAMQAILFKNGNRESVGDRQFWDQIGAVGTVNHSHTLRGTAIVDLAVGDTLNVDFYQVTSANLTMGLDGSVDDSSFRLLYLGRR